MFFHEILSFSRKWKSAFRLRRRERIGVQAPDFLALCLHFGSPFFALFFGGFLVPLGARFQWVGDRAGTPLNEFN